MGDIKIEKRGFGARIEVSAAEIAAAQAARPSLLDLKLRESSERIAQNADRVLFAALAAEGAADRARALRRAELGADREAFWKRIAVRSGPLAPGEAAALVSELDAILERWRQLDAEEAECSLIERMLPRGS